MTGYNWEEIIKTKNDNELLSFFKNDMITDLDAKYFAFCEIEARKLNNINIEAYKNNLAKNCEKHIETLSKRTIREFIILINPYIILSMSIYFLGLFLTNPIISFHNSYFDGMIFFGFGSIISFIISFYELRLMKENKRNKIEIAGKIITKLTAQ